MIGHEKHGTAVTPPRSRRRRLASGTARSHFETSSASPRRSPARRGLREDRSLGGEVPGVHGRGVRAAEQGDLDDVVGRNDSRVARMELAVDPLPELAGVDRVDTVRDDERRPGGLLREK